MRKKRPLFISILLIGFSLSGIAQKGTGDGTGIAGRNVVSVTENIEGTVQEVLHETCPQTTGRYDNGTHILIKPGSGDGQLLNIHLGPTAKLGDIVKNIDAGMNVSLKVFRTKKLPDNQYIAKEITVNNNTYALRDENLKPFWAGNRGYGRKRGN